MKFVPLNNPAFRHTQQFQINFNPEPKPTPNIQQIRDLYPAQMILFERFVQAIIHNDLSNEMGLFMRICNG